MFNPPHGYARNQMPAFFELRNWNSLPPKKALPQSSTSANGTGYFDAKKIA